MKYVLVLRHPFFLKNFTAGIRELLARGHQVEVVFSEPVKGRVGENLADEASVMLPGVRMHHEPPGTSADAFAIEIVATVIDVLRYDTPAYASSRYLRERANKMLGLLLGAKTLMRRARALAATSGYQAAHDALMGLLDSIEPPESIVKLLRRLAPDIVVVSPLTPFGSEQASYILAARRLGKPALYSMYSWDNLTNKGMLRPLPDGGIVWNESHRREAVELHGMAPETVLLAGAPGYDIWFDTKPSEDRDAFCRRVGLDPERPFVLYTCSSGSIARAHEAAFISSWIGALRAHPDPRVARIGVLIRPHPQNAQVFAGFDERRFENVAIHPREGAIPFAGSAREDFFNSIAQSIAVVGVNTSAMVEAAIIDRPIIAFENEAFDEGHLGTPHYRQLLTYEFLIRTPTIEQNVETIAKLAHEDADLLRYSREGNRRFVDEFIRPLDRTTPAAIRWADAVEELSRTVVSRPVSPAPAREVNAALAKGIPLAGWANAKFGYTAKRLYRGARRRLVTGSEATQKLISKGRARAGSHVRRRVRRAQNIYVHMRLFGFHGLPLSNPAFLAERERKRKILSEKGLFARIFDEGPFGVIERIETAFGGDTAAPGIVVLGDSVHLRIRFNDRDDRTLAEMTAAAIAPRSMLSLAGSAYHPRLYLAIIRAIAAMPRKPAIAVIPVNLRCFSPQWWLRPEHDYLNEIAALEGRSPGDPAPILPPYQKNKDLDRYRATPVSYPGFPFRTIGEFLDVIEAKPGDAAAKERRSRAIATFHMMHPLQPDHPWLADLVATIEAASAAGMRPLLYVTPINHMWGTLVAGPEFLDVVRRNLSVLRATVEPAVTTAGGRFEDWSLDFPDTLFFNLDEKTEHLSDKGRKELARRIAGLIDGNTAPEQARRRSAVA